MFTKHYANLVKNYVDGFIIGSEFKGMTSIFDSEKKTYPVVDKLIELSDVVRGIIGGGSGNNKEKIITYAADWSEYHSIGGDYYLDKLWAHKNIDVVGIDAYFPLTDIESYSRNPKIDEIINGWASGEGYEYYYENGNRDKKIYYDGPEFAWKNLEHWWSNSHKNKDGTQSPWQSKMKKIWFTEYGFPSLHGAANMPNVFYNPESSESALPVNSNGGINFDIQRTAIEATVKKWENSDMVENKLLWCYDARPYPQFPKERSIWSDGNLWIYGHWVNGKIGRCLLRRIIEDLFERLNKEDSIKKELTSLSFAKNNNSASQFDNIKIKPNTSQIQQSVDGFIINNNLTILDAFKLLQQCYFFDVRESEDEVIFIPRGNKEIDKIPYKDIVLEKNQTQISILKNDELSLPTDINLNFISAFDDYEVRNVNVKYNKPPENIANILGVADTSESRNNLSVDFPISMTSDYAKCIAQTILFSNHYQREQYDFSVPLWYSYLEPGDVINLEIQPGIFRTIRILNIIHSIYLKIKGVIEDEDLYSFRQGDSLLISQDQQKPQSQISKTLFEYGVITPLNFEEKGSIIFACTGEEENWKGANILLQNSSGKFEKVLSVNGKANFGRCLNVSVNNKEFLSYNNSLSSLTSEAIDPGSIQSLENYSQEKDDKLTLLQIINPHIIDTKNELYIFMTSGELSSIDDEEFYANGNTALYGNEIIQFKNAELHDSSNKIYKLTNLRRGLFGTEAFINNHDENDKFILLDDKVARFELSENDAGMIKKFRIITFNDSLENYIEQDIECDIRSYLYNYKVCDLRLELNNDDSSKMLKLSWSKRTRTKGEWMNFRDIIDYDDKELYEIEITNKDTGVIIEKKILENVNYYDHKIVTRYIIVSIFKLSSVFGATYGSVYDIDTNDGSYVMRL